MGEYVLYTQPNYAHPFDTPTIYSPLAIWLCLKLTITIFRPGPDQEVEPWKSGTGLKFGFLSIKNWAYVAIPWNPKTRVGPHSSYRIDGKNHAVQPLSNF